MLSRLAVVLAALAFVAVACGGSEDKGKTPSGARASCASDSDCTVSDSSGCCKSCPDQPFGMPVLAFEQQKNKCAVVECAASSDRIECPKVEPTDAFVAYCKEGTCAARKK
ncbi:MAG: hypothetical protein KIT84_05390 [Labilithrix sp.]|nr:hypothetical protein [Labilithrix sp.]MCW5810421.1 hypothetical protein [Labilithrix sp.]